MCGERRSRTYISHDRGSVCRREDEGFEQVEELVAEHADLERRLADPALHADAGAARRLGRRYAQLGPVVATYGEWRRVGGALGAATELAAQDTAFADEVVQLQARKAELTERLGLLLV